MTVRRVNPSSLSPPAGFTHVVLAEGQVLFLAGQTAQDASGAVVGTSIVEQFDQALANLVVALTAAGSAAEQLTKLVVYCVDVDAYLGSLTEIGHVWRARVGRQYPAMTFVGVQRLFDPAALIELDAFAVVR